MKNLSELHIEFIKASKAPAEMFCLNFEDAPEFIQQVRDFGIGVLPDVPIHMGPDLVTGYR